VCLKCSGTIYSNRIQIHLKGICTPGPPNKCPYHNEYAFEMSKNKYNPKTIIHSIARCIKCLDLKNMRYYGAQCIEGHEKFEKDKLLVSYTNNGQKEEDNVNKYTFISVNKHDGGDNTGAEFKSNNCDDGDYIRVCENVQDNSSYIAASNNAVSKGVARKLLPPRIEKKKQMRKIKIRKEKRKRKRERKLEREKEGEKKEKEREIT